MNFRNSQTQICRKLCELGHILVLLNYLTSAHNYRVQTENERK